MDSNLEKLREQHGSSNEVLHSVMPRFCFCCGGKLEEAGLGFLSCVECTKVYLPYENQDGEQSLALCNG